MNNFELSNKIFDCIFFYRMEYAKYNMQMHYHQHFEIMFVENGHCTVEIEGKNKKKIELNLKKNDFIFLCPQIPHLLTIEPSGEKQKIVNIEFRLTENNSEMPFIDFSDIYKNCVGIQKRFKENLYFIEHAKNDNILNTILEIQKNARIDQIKDVLKEQVLFYHLFYAIEADSNNTNNEVENHLAKACLFIQKNYHHQITNLDVSKYVNFHISYLQKLFKKYLNTSVNDYIINHRIKISKLLLELTNKPITDIAFEIGFNSRQNFYHSFKNATGVNPKDYRKSVQNYKSGQKSNYKTMTVEKKQS